MIEKYTVLLTHFYMTSATSRERFTISMQTCEKVNKFVSSVENITTSPIFVEDRRVVSERCRNLTVAGVLVVQFDVEEHNKGMKGFSDRQSVYSLLQIKLRKRRATTSLKWFANGGVNQIHLKEESTAVSWTSSASNRIIVEMRERKIKNGITTLKVVCDPVKVSAGTTIYI